ncbi:hypothetical protein [Lysobacter tyrosinilyticus]
MSNVVQFLEALARNPKPMSPEEFASDVISAELDAAAETALLQRDAIGLSRAIGGRSNVMCLIVPAENDEPQENDQDGDEQAPDSEPSSRAA